MDRVGSDFYGVVEQIQKELGANAVPVAIPIGAQGSFRGLVDLVENCAVLYGDRSDGTDFREEPVPAELRAEADRWRRHLIEKVSEVDEHLLEKFCADQSVTVAELRAAIRKATHAHRICPVLCGSAIRNIGIRRLLDAVVDYLPSPIDLPPISGRCLEGNAIERVPRDDGRLAVLAFKVMADKHVGKLVFVRVYSGTLAAGTYVLNPSRKKKQRIGRIVRMHANRREMIDALYAGEIGAVVGLTDTVTGDTLCCEEDPIVLEAIEFPAPVLAMAVISDSRPDADKLSLALNRLAEEDPTFVVSSDPETEDIIISGMGELHLEIILDRLQREYGVAVAAGAPQVAYRETLTSPAEVSEKLVKQTGGRGQYAHVVFTVEPLDPGQGFEFVNEVVGGRIPKEYIPAVERGVIGAMSKGVWAGFPVVDVRVTLTDGSFHEVDSSELAFRTCASMAFKKAFMAGEPELLEPIMSVSVVVPEEFAGGVVSNLCSKRGHITGMERQGTAQAISAMVPLATMFGYATEVRNLTQGRGTFTMHFEHYEAVPLAIAEEVIAEKKARTARS
jgi:elongation factor G